MKKCFLSFFYLLLPKKCDTYACMNKLLIFKHMKRNERKSLLALENVNMLIINTKVDEYIKRNELLPTEEKIRLVKMTLRHHVHHFPTGIPFIAAVRKCGEKQVVFSIKRTKFAVIDDIDISSETNVGKEFEISGVRYVQADTINGYPRFKPVKL